MHGQPFKPFQMTCCPDSKEQCMYVIYVYKLRLDKIHLIDPPN